MQPLDLIFFRGTDVVSNTISALEAKILGSGEFTHVGILINSDLMPWIPDLTPGKWYIWESVVSIPLAGFTDEIPDVRTGKGGYGVQIRDLDAVIKKYSGVVVHGALKSHLRRDFSAKKLKKLYRKYGMQKYDANCLSLFGAMIPKLRPLRDALVVEKGHLFCSELVATIYRGLRILPKSTDPRNFVPMHLVELTEIDFLPDGWQK